MTVEIVQVANGWIVYPGSGMNRNYQFDGKTIHVFNSFNDLTAYLKEQSGLK